MIEHCLRHVKRYLVYVLDKKKRGTLDPLCRAIHPFEFMEEFVQRHKLHHTVQLLLSLRVKYYRHKRD